MDFGSAAGRRSRRSRRLQAGHNVTPEEDYRTRPASAGRVPIARTQGVRYRPASQICGNDPDAQPACGTPRAGCHAAAVIPSFHTRNAGTVPERGTAPWGRPEAPSTSIARWRERKQSNKIIKPNNTYTVAPEIGEGELAFIIEIAKEFFGAPMVTRYGYARQGSRNTSNHRCDHGPRRGRSRAATF